MPTTIFTTTETLTVPESLDEVSSKLHRSRGDAFVSFDSVGVDGQPRIINQSAILEVRPADDGPANSSE